MNKIPEHLVNLVMDFTPLQKAYCEFRAKGMPQHLAAEKAGSQAEGRANLARSGFQIEQIPGAKEYIDFLKSQRLSGATLDDVELIRMLREVYDKGMDKGDPASLKAANQSVELMFKIMGGGKGPAKPTTATTEEDGKEKVNISAFLEDNADKDLATRVIQLQDHVKDIK